jgi:hypothetical protein
MTNVAPASTQEYRRAFVRILPMLTPNQLDMLRYHLGKQRPVTATELAAHVGYADWRGVNAQYGRIGADLRKQSARIAKMEGQKSHAFAEFAQVPRKNRSYPEWEWTLYPAVRRALNSLRRSGVL